MAIHTSVAKDKLNKIRGTDSPCPGAPIVSVHDHVPRHSHLVNMCPRDTGEGMAPTRHTGSESLENEGMYFEHFDHLVNSMDQTTPRSRGQPMLSPKVDTEHIASQRLQMIFPEHRAPPPLAIPVDSTTPEHRPAYMEPSSAPPYTTPAAKSSAYSPRFSAAFRLPRRTHANSTDAQEYQRYNETEPPRSQSASPLRAAAEGEKKNVFKDFARNVPQQIKAGAKNVPHQIKAGAAGAGAAVLRRLRRKEIEHFARMEKSRRDIAWCLAELSPHVRQAYRKLCKDGNYMCNYIDFENGFKLLIASSLGSGSAR